VGLAAPAQPNIKPQGFVMTKRSFSSMVFVGVFNAVRSLEKALPKVRYLPWQAIVCIILACFALYSLLGSQSQHQDLAKQRLFEIALQDLSLHSTAFHHLTEARPAQLRMALLQRGFDTPMALLNQMDARLALIETLQLSFPYEVPVQRLRLELEWLIRQYADSRSGPQEPVERIRSHVDHWHNQLQTLSRASQTQRAQEPALLKSLRMHNTWLALCLLALVAWPLLRIVGKRTGLLSRWRKRWQHNVNTNKHDVLTGVYNRQAWLEHIHGVLYGLRQRPHAQGTEADGSVLIVQVDGLETYRETFGEAAANMHIRQCAEQLRLNYRPGDFIARVHEDQFFIVLPECNSVLAQRTLERLRERDSSLEFSAGVCTLDQQHSIEHLMALADQALYQARRNPVKDKPAKRKKRNPATPLEFAAEAQHPTTQAKLNPGKDKPQESSAA
jgi:diguanylate cyclase (GGDEF)-like protein